MQDLSWLPSESKDHDSLLLCFLVPISKVTLSFQLFDTVFIFHLLIRKLNEGYFVLGKTRVVNFFDSITFRNSLTRNLVKNRDL